MKTERILGALAGVNIVLLVGALAEPRSSGAQDIAPVLRDGRLKS